MTDPNNVMALKYKLSNSASTNLSCYTCQASPKHKEDKATEPKPTNTKDIQDNDLVDPEIAYKEMKALVDADCNSSWVLSLFDTL